MRINNINSVSFGILNRSSIEKRPYGEYYNGNYKDNKIEVYNAYKDKERLIYVSDKYGNFIKYKLTYYINNFKKITRSGRSFY